MGTVVSSGTSGGLMSHLPTNAVGKQALASALQHGFVAVLIFALLALGVTFFLKEIPIVVTQEEVAQKDEEADKELMHA
ncbi:MAG: hypothetical protein NVS4B11_21850 [Ktedonobacteraceae bacterium]